MKDLNQIKCGFCNKEIKVGEEFLKYQSVDKKCKNKDRYARVHKKCPTD